MHFPEAARFLNALDLAGREVNLLFAPQKSAVSADCQVDHVPPPPQCLGPETTTLFSFAEKYQ